MAAQNTVIDVNPNTWTELTGNTITAATWQVQGAYDVRVQATATQTAPTSLDDGLIYGVKQTKQGEVSSRTLAELFPGVVGVRLYARSMGGDSKVFISHAAS